jgi:hypothetical protein
MSPVDANSSVRWQIYIYVQYSVDTLISYDVMWYDVMWYDVM